MTNNKTKAGRPERPKASLFAEIQRHKSHIRDLIIENDYLEVELNQYREAGLLSRIKYVIKKEI